MTSHHHALTRRAVYLGIALIVLVMTFNIGATALASFLPPTANPDFYGATEDTLLIVVAPGVLANDSDPENDPLIMQLNTFPSHGGLSWNPSGTFTYSPAPNNCQPDSFTYFDFDGTNISNIATVNINIACVNDAPVTGNAGFTTNEETQLNATLGANDIDNDPLSYSVVSAPTHGVINGPIASTGAFTYTPSVNFNGSDSFTFKVNDGNADSNTATVTINIDPVNDPPSFTAGANQTVSEDAGPQMVSGWAQAISAGPPDESGQPLNFIVTGNTNPSLFGGQPVVAPDGRLVYVPAPDANGSAMITLILRDNGGTTNGGNDTSGPQTFTITVNAVNDAPVNSVPSAQTTNEDTALIFSSANGNPLGVDDIDAASSVISVTLGVTNGALTLGGTTGLTFSSGDGTADASMLFTGTLASINTALNGLNYAPTLNYNGPANLTLTTNDLGNTGSGGAKSDSDTIAITINSVNDAPSFTIGANQTVNEDAGAQSVSSWATAISVGPTDEISQTFGFSITGNTNPSLFASGPAVANNGTLSYTPAANANGSATLTLTLTDSGGTANGGIASSTQTFTITINAVNDGPVNGVPSAQTTNEDTALVFNSANSNLISVGDLDAGSSAISVTLTVTNGTLTLGGTTGLTFSTGDGTADASMLFTGSLTNVNTALNGLSYAPTVNYHGAASLAIATNDLGNTGSGGAKSDSDTVAITVNSVNDAPSFTIGANQTVNEDAGAQSVSGWATSISAGPTDEISQTLVFSISGNTNPGLFASAPAVANNGTLTYTPAANANGSATLTLTLTDNGGTANGGIASSAQTFTITINAVNDAPLNSIPSAQTTNEDIALVFKSANSNLISIGDLDAGSSSISVTLAVTNGALTLSSTTGLTFSSGDGTADASMIFTGSLTNVNAALNGLSYVPIADYHGAASLSIAINDLGNTGSGGALEDSDTIAITINSVNDAPTFVIGANQTINEGAGAQSVSGWATLISAGPANEISQTLVFSITGNTNPGLFAIAPVVALDGTLTYTPVANANGSATLTLKLSDNGGTANGGIASSTQTFIISVTAVNDAPVNSVPGAQTTIEDTALIFSSANSNLISVNDIDLGSGNVISITLGVAHGTLTLGSTTGLTFSSGDGTADASMIFTGSLTNVNAALASLTYTPTLDYAGADSLTLTSNDLGHTGSGGALEDSDTIAITVNSANDAPVNSAPSAQTTNEDTALVFSSANGNSLSVGDPDADSSAISIALGVTNGTLTLGGTTGLTFSSGDGTTDASMVFTGTLTSINTALSSLTYAPTPDFNGAASLTITSNDLGNTGSGGALSDSDTIAITVRSVNDAPSFTIGANQLVNEDAGAQSISGWAQSISAGPANEISQTLTFAVSGSTSLFASGPTVAANGTLSYTPAANASGSATFMLTLSDNGGTANSGIASAAAQSFTITISGVNDAPVNSVPSAQTTNEDTALVFSSANGNRLSVGDIDAGIGNVYVTLSVTNGTLTLGSTAGLTFIFGDGTNDSVMTFTAGTSAVNTALNGLKYLPAADFNGVASLFIDTSDLGNTGGGGALSDSDSVAITVSALNDGPVNTVPAAQATNEDTALVFSTANGNAIGITDVDSASNPILVMLSVVNGTLSLSGVHGLTFSTGDGSADPSMTFTGALADVSAALNGMAYMPAPNDNGVTSLTIASNDQGNTGNGSALGDSDSVVITITAVDDPPTITGIVDQTTGEDISTSAIGFKIGDVETIAESLIVSASSSNTALLPNANILPGGSGANQTITLTPAANQNGVTTISVSVSDGTNTTTTSFKLTVTAINDPPTLNALADVSLAEDAPAQTINLSGISTGPANEIAQTLVVTATSSNLALIANPVVSYSNGSAIGVLSFTPLANASGVAMITVRAKDNGGTISGGADSELRTFTVTVAEVNDPPTLNAIGDIAVLESAPQQTLTLSGISAGPVDERSQHLTVTATSSDPALVPNPTISYTDGAITGTLRFTPAPNMNGSASISVQVSDDGGTPGVVASRTRTFTIFVGAVNQRPTLNQPADLTLLEDAGAQTVTLNGISAGSAPEAAQTLVVTVSSNAPALITNPTVSYTSGSATGTLSFTPLANAYGTALISVRVQDNGGTGNGGVDVIEKTFTVQVTSVNDAPDFTAGPNEVTSAQAGPQAFAGWAHGFVAGPTNEADQIAIGYSVVAVSNPAIFAVAPAIDAAGRLTYTPAAGADGSATISVRAQDSGGTANGGLDSSAIKTFTITVRPLVYLYLPIVRR